MPTYQVFATQGMLEAEEKQAISQAITAGHMAQTGAPRYYIQVIFQETATENRYIGGHPYPESIWVRGDVRERTPEADQALMLELVERIAAACPKLDKNMIWIDLCAVQPTDILKFCTVFPPAGEEATWYAALPAEAKAAIEKVLKNI